MDHTKSSILRGSRDKSVFMVCILFLHCVYDVCLRNGSFCVYGVFISFQVHVSSISFLRCANKHCDYHSVCVVSCVYGCVYEIVFMVCL